MLLLKKTQFFYLFLIYLFVTACASVGTPEGGIKDEIPPKLISSTPKNRALNITGNTLEFTFDEEIQTKDLNRQILITPNTNNPFKATVKKETLKLEFENAFIPNTTYFINFRSAVLDRTEGNKPQNLTFTFSTGAYIDSGQVSGTVRDLYTNLPEKNINVALYPARDTTTIRKHKPFYFTQTDDKGNYQLQNIKIGEYRILAHQDKNNNLVYDNENEKIAYQKDYVNVTAKTPIIDLTTLRIDTRKPTIESSEKFTDTYRINYSEGLTALKIAPINAPATIAPSVNIITNKGKTAAIYPTATLPKTDYLVTITDSAGNTGTDTVSISFEGKKSPRGNEAFKVKSYNGQLTKEEPLQLDFVVPIKVVQPQALTIIEDSVNRRTLSYPQDFNLNASATSITIKELVKAKRTVQILVDTTKILPVSGEPFKKQTAKFIITNKISLGSLLGKLSTSYKRYWVEILNENYQPVLTLDTPKALKLDKLEPGRYRIRVKIDENNDGKWRAGNKDLTTPVERIYHFPEIIEIRANWEIEENLSF